MHILIGSRALYLRAPKLLQRAPLDFDFIATEDEVPELLSFIEKIGGALQQESESRPQHLVYRNEKTIVEIELATHDGTSAAMFHSLVHEDEQTKDCGMFGKIPSLDALFTLKKSHRFLKNSPHFWKTFFDYHAMKEVGAKVPLRYSEFFSLREKETYNYKHPSLMRNKKDFFNESEGVDYVYDHDSIHRAVAIFDRPAYTYFQRDDHDVAVDRKKFDAAPFDVKVASVIEEACVLALERSIVPHGVPEGGPKQVWLFALSKVLSSITSGWWREWAYENALDVLLRYPEDFVEKFNAGVKSGLVVPFKKSA